MKRLLMFLIIIGIFIGSFFTLRTKFFESVEKNEVIKPIENETYIDELNLPLIEVDTMNPILTQNKQVCDILKLIYEPLFDFDEKNKIVPKLADEWNEKDDNTWIIKLNKSATWHSDKIFSADDVIFTYNAIIKSDASVYKENIKNIVSIDKIDDNAIQINLNEKDTFLIYKLSFPIIPKYYFESDMKNDYKNIRAIGTGPYKVESISDDGNIINLISNEKWWNNEKIKLKKIFLFKYQTYGEAIKAFKSTEIDVISTTMSSWQKKFGAIGINAYMYESNEFNVIIPNNRNVLLKENSVRRMISTVINEENIIESIHFGNGKVSNCPVKSNSYLKTTLDNNTYDIEKAKQLLINAGWNNSSGTWKKQIQNKTYTLKFDLLVNSDSEEKIEMANLIVENLKEIGVTVKIVKVNTKEFYKRIENAKYDLALVTLNLDMDTDLIELINSSSDKNFAGYENIEIDNIVTTLNENNVSEKFKHIQEIYKNESPYIGMYYKCNNLLTNKSVKGNINPTSWNVYHDITGWCK